MLKIRICGLLLYKSCVSLVSELLFSIPEQLDPICDVHANVVAIPIRPRSDGRT